MSLLGTGVEKLAKAVLMQVTLIFTYFNKILIMTLTSVILMFAKPISIIMIRRNPYISKTKGQKKFTKNSLNI